MWGSNGEGDTRNSSLPPCLLTSFLPALPNFFRICNYITPYRNAFGICNYKHPFSISPVMCSYTTPRGAPPGPAGYLIPNYEDTHAFSNSI